MRILALETSTREGSVAVLDDQRVLGEAPLEPSQRTAQAFAPAIARQLAAVGWTPTDVQLVAVTVGPGSFTGLRIGVTAAKTFAYAVGAEIVGVNTLEVIARQVPHDPPLVCSVLDAQRQQLFSATYRRENGDLRSVGQAAIVDQPHWLASLPADVVVTGPGLTRVLQQLPAGVVVADQRFWNPQAATVGRLAGLDSRAGKRDDLWKLNPLYFRPSAAEEKLSPQEPSGDHRDPEGNQA
jgi:tRNA threonylcarbamoyladenosine biosynthesis protein TsaB